MKSTEIVRITLSDLQIERVFHDTTNFGEGGLEKGLLDMDCGLNTLAIPLERDGYIWTQSCFNLVTRIKGNTCTLLTHSAPKEFCYTGNKPQAKCLRFIKSQKVVVLEEHKVGECPYTTYGRPIK